MEHNGDKDTKLTELDAADYFTDPQLLENPYPYFDHLRSKGPVVPTGYHRVVAITAYDEAAAVFRDNENFSACNSVAGPFTRFLAPLEGDNVAEIIRQNRDQIVQNDLVVTMDPPMHTRERALMMRLITPKRLEKNQEFIWRLADERIDQFIANGRCEFINEYAHRLTMLVIADLLGVPREHHDIFIRGFGMTSEKTGAGDLSGEAVEELNTLQWLYEYFAKYVEDRRRDPQQDVLTELANAKYPDDSTPDVMAVVHIATFLFAAGQETTARLLGSALKFLAEFPELQDRLRENRDLIPTFVEEALRLSTPIKTNFRMAIRPVTVGDITVAPGTPVVIFNGAVSRDPSRFENPDEFRLDRANSREHIAFGRGVHTCPGGPLARAEAQITIDRLLTRTRNIRFDESHHGAPDARTFNYEPSWMIRGLRELHLQFDQAPS